MGKLKNILILFICLTYGLFRGKADKKVINPKKILIVQLAKMGDMVCTTPVFRVVKQRHPGCKIYLVCRSYNRELLEGNKDVDEFFEFDQEKICKNIKQIKKESFDAAILFNFSFSFLASAFLANIPCVVAPYLDGDECIYETRPFKLLKRLTEAKPYRIGGYIPLANLGLLEPINVFSSNTEKYLAYSEKAKIKIDELLVNNKISGSDYLVGISPVSGSKMKLWPAEKFAQLADALIEEYQARIFLVGNNDEAQINLVMGSIKNKKQIINTFDLLNLEELKALIARLNIFISCDTGPVYIAEALKTPTIDIVGPIDENEQPPRGKLNKIVKINRPKAAVHIMNASKFDKKEAYTQINNITVEMVIEKFKELLEEIKYEK